MLFQNTKVNFNLDGKEIKEAQNTRKESTVNKTKVDPEHKKRIENIKKSEKLRSDINKKVNEGLPESEVLKLALECISLMTGDQSFYNQNMEKLNKNM